MLKLKLKRQARRKIRVSTNIVGSAERPRISIYRSNRYIYAQAIVDTAEKTIVSYSSAVLKEKGNKSEIAKLVGKKLAELMKEKKITKAVFDRGSYSYNGRVKSLAEGLREGEIQV